MSKFKAGDKVVCILKERPYYFNQSGAMDYMLDRKTVLEVKGVDDYGVRVDGEDAFFWYLEKEDIELYEEPTTPPFNVGDKVVCIAKERPYYFVEEMDYMLDKKEVLEVKEVRENWVIVYDESRDLWYLRNEDLELYEDLNLTKLIEKVKQWSIERNIHQASPKEQTLKLLEETGELASALLKSNNDLIIDSLGDILVVLVILHQQLGLTMEQTLSYAYEEIKDRKGKTVGGVFVKDSDL